MTPDQIKKLVMDAYSEGFSDGADHQNLPWKYPPVGISWQMSETRELLTGEQSQKARRDYQWWDYSNNTIADIPME